MQGGQRVQKIQGEALDFRMGLGGKFEKALICSPLPGLGIWAAGSIPCSGRQMSQPGTPRSRSGQKS